jgi:amino acid transporter
MFNLCPPAIIYLIFSITQILIDIYQGLFNTAIMKSIVCICVTILLNILCSKGLSMVSWIFVFIPFIFMTIIVAILLYTFGLNPTTGTLNNGISNNKQTYKDISFDNSGNIIIYDPEYNSNINPVYFKSPNIIVPNPHSNDNNKNNTTYFYNTIPSGSTSPIYVS